MTRTPYATRTYDTSQKGPRVPNVTPSFIVIHHAATLDFDAVINLEMGAREVSSTVIIKDGQVASMFDEVYRAWSLSSQYWDSVSLSSETCNETTAPGWTISEASYQTLAKVVAGWCSRYGIACNRTQILGHREVYTRYGASYATACPGGIDLDRVVRDAAAILAGGSAKPTQEVDIMAKLIRNKKTGEIWAVNIDTGFEWYVPTPDYLTLVQGWKFFDPAPVRDMDDNIFVLYRQLAATNRAAGSADANAIAKATAALIPAPDYAKLATEIVKNGGTAPTADQIAKAVNDDLHARTAQ